MEATDKVGTCLYSSHGEQRIDVSVGPVIRPLSILEAEDLSERLANLVAIAREERREVARA